MFNFVRHAVTRDTIASEHAGGENNVKTDISAVSADTSSCSICIEPEKFYRVIPSLIQISHTYTPLRFILSPSVDFFPAAEPLLLDPLRHRPRPSWLSLCLRSASERWPPPL